MAGTTAGCGRGFPGFVRILVRRPLHRLAAVESVVAGHCGYYFCERCRYPVGRWVWDWWRKGKDPREKA